MDKNSDLIGKKFTKLLVKKKLQKQDGKQYWLCQCDCGNEHTVHTFNLKYGYTKSCGCLRRIGYNKLPEGEASFNEMYYDYKRHALKRNVLFKLTKKQFKSMTEKVCYYCGATPDHAYGPKVRTRPNGEKRARNGFYYGNGIDRKDPNLGYIKNNCVSCCVICNFFKKDLSSKEFLKLIRKIYSWRKRK